MIRDGKVVPTVNDCLLFLPDIDVLVRRYADKMYSEIIEETEYYLSKLVPTEPFREGFKDYNCAKCGAGLRYPHPSGKEGDLYCPHCGQAVNWNLE